MKSNIPINSGVLKFTFSDEDGDIIASLRLNPTDVRMAARAEEVSEWFDELKDRKTASGGIADVKEYNDEIEDKIAFILGEGTKPEVFGVLPATTVLPSGEIFAAMILNTIVEHLGPAVRERRAKMEEAVAKYTDEYESGDGETE